MIIETFQRKILPLKKQGSTFHADGPAFERALLSNINSFEQTT